MTMTSYSRRNVSFGTLALFAALTASPLGMTQIARAETPAGSPGLATDAEAIHQEVHIDASRHRVYEALTNPQQYDKVEKLGTAMQTVLKSSTTPTQLSSNAGGTFVLFGGHVSGRNLELVPDTRIVQAWREGNWKPGVYSMVKFDLVDDGAGTKIVFDHTGFPQGGGASLTHGWYENYWNPLKKYLAQ